MRFVVLMLLAGLFGGLFQPVYAEDPVALAKVYGKDADISAFDLSPSGTKVAYIMQKDGERYVVASELATFQTIASIKIEDYFITDLSWANEETILMFAIIFKYCPDESDLW